MDSGRIVLRLWLAVGFPVSAVAGWGADLWPAWDYQRKGKLQGQECWSGTVERCDVAGISYPATQTWYRLQRTNLQNLKDKVEELVPYFVDTNEVDAGATSFAGWFQTLQAGSYPTDFPMLTISGVCTHVGIPTNYFDYTPWRCLNGRGPFTTGVDYAAIGHPHGWTNATTADGGSISLPAGRTNWYTTDYGWEGLKAAINLLRYSRTNATAVASTNSTHGYYNGEGWGHDDDGEWDSLGSVLGDWSKDNTSVGWPLALVDTCTEPDGWDNVIGAVADNRIDCTKTNMIWSRYVTNEARTAWEHAVEVGHSGVYHAAGSPIGGLPADASVSAGYVLAGAALFAASDCGETRSWSQVTNVIHANATAGVYWQYKWDLVGCSSCGDVDGTNAVEGAKWLEPWDERTRYSSYIGGDVPNTNYACDREVWALGETPAMVHGYGLEAEFVWDWPFSPSTLNRDYYVRLKEEVIADSPGPSTLYKNACITNIPYFATADIVQRGFAIDSGYVLWRWDVAGGFAYVE